MERTGPLNSSFVIRHSSFVNCIWQTIMDLPFSRIGIVGVGLIGGSLGLALKKAGWPVHVRGLGRDAAQLSTAVRLGTIDDFATTDRSITLQDRDLVILATPVEQILEMLETAADSLRPGTLVTDVGGTKRRICETARRCLPASVEFIGGHPIAGREVAGVENASAALFQDAPYVLCPADGLESRNLARLSGMIQGIGARPCVMSAEEHDRTMAFVSHLPQILSTALAGLVAGERLEVSGGGFRDMVRLAGSPYSVWKGVIETNADNIELALEAYVRQLQRLREILRNDSLAQEFDRAALTYRKVNR